MVMAKVSNSLETIAVQHQDS